MLDDPREPLAKLKEGLQAIYGDRLRGVYLYGSYARGEATEDADMDVLIVLDEVSPSYLTELRRSSELTSTLSLEYDVSISRVLLADGEWSACDSFFLQNVRRDAVAA